MSHLSSMEFLGRDPTSQAAPEQQGYFWSRLRFSSEPFSPQFCPGPLLTHGAAATLTELCMVLGWSRDPLLKCGGGHLQEHPWEGGKEGVSPLQSLDISVQKRQQADGHVTGQILTGCRSANRAQTQSNGCVLPAGCRERVKFHDSAGICSAPRKASLLRRFMSVLKEGNQTKLKQINGILGKYPFFPLNF